MIKCTFASEAPRDLGAVKELTTPQAGKANGVLPPTGGLGICELGQSGLACKTLV